MPLPGVRLSKACMTRINSPSWLDASSLVDLEKNSCDGSTSSVHAVNVSDELRGRGHLVVIEERKHRCNTATELVQAPDA